MEKACAFCSALFVKKPSCSVRSWPKVRYCSKRCYTESQRKKGTYDGGRRTGPAWNKGMKMGPSPRKSLVTLVCAHCESSFEVKKYRSTKAKCCSVRCSIAMRDKGLSDLNERARKSLALRKWREAVFKRDDFTCQECGKRGGTLNADHIKPFAFFPDLRFELGNGRTLCEPCHRATPTFGVKAWRAVAQEA